MAIVVGGLTLMAYTGSYLSVERIAIALGAFELVFLFVAWAAKPDLAASGVNLVSLSVGVQVMNALLLPIVWASSTCSPGACPCLTG